MFMQRYIERFPAAGEVIIFDRSWYNRAGVEYVMGFCSEEQHRRFLELCPQIEKYIVEGGITLIKIWLEVGQGRAGTTFCGSHQRSVAAVEIEPDGCRVIPALV